MTRIATGLVAVAVACTASHAPAGDSSRSITAGGGTALGDAAVEAFAAHYETVANRRDIEAINACVSEAALVDLARTSDEVPDALWQSFAAGVRQGFDWGGAIARAIGEDGHFRVLNTRRVDGESRVMLRMLAGDGGLNYHDLILAPSPETGEPRIVDVHVYLSGERISETLGRQLEQFLAAQQSNDETYLRSIRTMGLMSEDLRAGRFSDVLVGYARMPESMQRSRPVQVMRLTAASKVGAEAFRRALADFRSFYPRDPSIDLLTLDQFVEDEAWRDAIHALERIRTAVGGDPYLDALVANMVLRSGDVDRAERLARAAIEREPTIDQGYWTLLDIALEQHDHPETVRLLNVLEDTFGWSFDDLGQVEAYADFVRSADYAEWNETRRISRVGSAGE